MAAIAQRALVRRDDGPFAALMGSLGSLKPGENPYTAMLEALGTS